MAELARDVDRDTVVEVRDQVRRFVAGHGLSDLDGYRFLVAVNEIVTNAVQHGGGSGRVELWRAGDRLYCRVTDHGPGMPARWEQPDPPVYALRGRGLWLARRSCAGLTVRSTPEGTAVTLHHRILDG